MTCTQRHNARYYCFLFLVVAAFVVLGSRPAVAQGQDFGYDECYDSACEMEFVGAIAASTSSTEIDTYAITNVSYDLEQACQYDSYEYCEFAAIESDLYDNGSWIDGNYDDDSWDGGDGFAEVDLSDPVNVGDVYDLYNDHGYVPCYYDENGLECDDTIFLVTYQIQIPTAAPTISNINPTDATVGSSGQITVTGNGLVDAFGVAATPAITGSGVTLSVSSVDSEGTQEVLNYSIIDTATTGNQTLTMSNRFGTSSGVTFRVGDPTPVVTSVSPGVWQAGTAFPVTISGTGFGTSPSVSVSGVGVAIGSPINPTDTQFTANVTVNSDAPGQTVTVTVQSNGYLGNGFVGATNGQSPTGSNNAQVVPITLPTPQILMEQSAADQGNCDSGTILSGQQQVYAGQSMLLTGCVSGLPNGVTITSQTWSVQNVADISGGYCAPNAYATCGSAGQESTNPAMTNVSNVAFYWVNPDSSEAVTYQYCVNNNNNQCASTSISFNIKGPIAGSNGLMSTTNSIVTISGPPYLAFGTYNSTGGVSVQGVGFYNNATAPSDNGGTFQWLQVVTYDQYQELLSSGMQVCTPNTRQSDPEGNPELDNYYPYPMQSTGNTGDSPANSLSQEGEKQRSFSATMTLMWDPTLNLDGTQCTAASTNSLYQSHQSTCTGSIPIPLASVQWKWSGCGVNTLNSQVGVNGWSIQAGCGIFSVGTVITSAVFPEWSVISQNQQNGQQTWTCSAITTE